MDDLYLSDIHIENSSYLENNNDENSALMKISRIEFTIPNKNLIDSNFESSKPDSDGDLVYESKTKKYLFKIQHKLETNLNDVGFQLWRASFYLMDFLIFKSNLIENKCLIELGAGLGLVSMTAQLFASTVYCTDLPQIVEQAELNFNLNKQSLNSNNSIYFKSINWFDSNEYLISDSDIDWIKNTQVFIAADVIYDDTLTIKFMNTLYKLLTCGNTNQIKTCYIAGEQRINFSAYDFESSDCAYNFFKDSLFQLDDYVDSEIGVKFKVILLDCTQMPKFVLNYERTDYLYIWKLEMLPID
jgi:methyltransferase-like protein 22